MDFLSNPTGGFAIKRNTPVAGERASIKAAQNAATTGNWLDGGDAADLQIINTDTFIFGGWIKWADSEDAVFITKGDANTGLDDSYSLYLTGSNGLMTFTLGGTTGAGDIDSLDPLVSGTKAFVVFWATLTTANIKVNAGTTATRSAIVRSGLSDPGGNFTLFANDDGSGGLGTKCIMDEWFFCKNPSDMTAALALISSTIYNGGLGTHYSALSATDKTVMGLTSWWGLDEATGVSRHDLHGTNNLSLNGTITQVNPLTV